MRCTSLTVAALAGLAAAQNLTSILSGNNQTSQLATLLGRYPQLVAALSNATNITVLAPSNQAIAALTSSPLGAQFAGNSNFAQAVLQYHVLQGTFHAADLLASNTSEFVQTSLSPGAYANVTGGQYVQASASAPNVSFVSGLLSVSNVVQADLNFTGGVVHVIDSVLTLPANASTTAVAANLTALAGALSMANLVNTVESLSDITVFAPNNAAFQAIGSALPNLTTEQLTSILTYHVVQGAVVFSTDLQDGQNVTTVNGGNLTIHAEGDSFFVNGAEIVQPNVLIQNGVVHVIDNVLNPNNTSAAPSASATAGAPAYSGASTVSSIAITSGIPSPSTTLGTGATAASRAGSGSATGSASATSTGAASKMNAALPVAGLLAAGAAFLV